MYIIFSKYYDSRSDQLYTRLVRFLSGQGYRVAAWGLLYDEMSRQGFADLQRIVRLSDRMSVRGAHCVLSVGGDGTFLDAAKLVMGTEVPVLGINRGRLGFLSDVPPDNLQEALDDLVTGNYRTIDVPMLNLYVNDSREPIGYAINEFAVSKCDNSSMLTIDTFIDGDFMTTYWADGLIVSTAIGSTAYSLSVGGPIVCPSSPSIIMTPVAPHNLTMRPLVLPDNVAINMRVDGRGPNIMASFDGQTHLISNGVWLRIARAKAGVRRIQLRSYSFFEALRDKLLWGADMRNAKVDVSRQSSEWKNDENDCL